MYRSCSTAIPTRSFRDFSLNTAHVGLLGLIRQIATVFDVIFVFMSSRSGVELFRSTENSIGTHPNNLT